MGGTQANRKDKFSSELNLMLVEKVSANIEEYYTSQDALWQKMSAEIMERLGESLPWKDIRSHFKRRIIPHLPKYIKDQEIINKLQYPYLSKLHKVRILLSDTEPLQKAPDVVSVIQNKLFINYIVNGRYDPRTVEAFKKCSTSGMTKIIKINVKDPVYEVPEEMQQLIVKLKKKPEKVQVENFKQPTPRIVIGSKNNLFNNKLSSQSRISNGSMIHSSPVMLDGVSVVIEDSSVYKSIKFTPRDLLEKESLNINTQEFNDILEQVNQPDNMEEIMLENRVSSTSIIYNQSNSADPLEATLQRLTYGMSKPQNSFPLESITPENINPTNSRSGEQSQSQEALAESTAQQRSNDDHDPCRTTTEDNLSISSSRDGGEIRQDVHITERPSPNKIVPYALSDDDSDRYSYETVIRRLEPSELNRIEDRSALVATNKTHRAATFENHIIPAKRRRSLSWNGVMQITSGNSCENSTATEAPMQENTNALPDISICEDLLKLSDDESDAENANEDMPSSDDEGCASLLNNLVSAGNTECILVSDDEIESSAGMPTESSVNDELPVANEASASDMNVEEEDVSAAEKTAHDNNDPNDDRGDETEAADISSAMQKSARQSPESPVHESHHSSKDGGDGTSQRNEEEQALPLHTERTNHHVQQDGVLSASTLNPNMTNAVHLTCMSRSAAIAEYTLATLTMFEETSPAFCSRVIGRITRLLSEETEEFHRLHPSGQECWKP